MSEIQWYYPESVDEAVELIGRDRVIPHSGGTGILRSSMKNLKGLVDLSRLPFHYHHTHGRTVELGACVSLSEAVSYLRGVWADCVLTKSLASAASTPLRNRITLGGSICLFPPWSDLMGPLLALDAEVELAGQGCSRCSVEDYTNESEIRRGTLVTAVRFKMQPWDYYYFRETRTFQDHPALTLTLLSMRDGDTIKKFRAVVTGCVGRYMRLNGVEELLVGAPIQHIELDRIDHAIHVRFAGKKAMSPDYLKHLVSVQVRRGITNFIGR
jgi:CO/xanthine dehydrogenase FAD-binding subunit